MTKQVRAKAAPKATVTTAQITQRIERAFSSFIKASCLAIAAGNKATHNLAAEIREAAFMAGVTDHKTYAKRFAGTINGAIDKAAAQGAIAASSVPVYKVTYKIWFMGHAAGLKASKADAGPQPYSVDVRPQLVAKKLLEASTKGRKASAPKTPATVVTPAVAASEAVARQEASKPALTVVPTVSKDKSEARIQYLNAAAFLLGGTKYAQAFCDLLASDKEVLTKILDARMADVAHAAE